MMSDTEAGDCEGPENPQPEDEAHLATFTVQDTPVDAPSPSSPSQPAQPHACGDTAQDADSRTAGRTASQGVATSVCPEDSEDGGGREGETTTPDVGGGDQGGLEQRGRAGEESGQASTPESDRAGCGTQEGGGMECSEDDAGGEKGGPAVGDGGGRQGVAVLEDVVLMAQSAERGEPSPAVCSDHWDQEESPPEDELFSQPPFPACQPPSAAEESAAADSDRGNASLAQSDPGSPALSHSAADDDTPGPQQGGVVQSPSPSPSPGPVQNGVSPPVAAAEKEDDQVPECDRESPAPSPPAACVHIAHDAQCDGSVQDNSQSSLSDGRARGGDSEGAVAGERHSSAPSQQSTSDSAHSPQVVSDSAPSPHSSAASQSASWASPDRVHRSPADHCDSSSHCDTAASPHSSIPTQRRLPQSQESGDPASTPGDPASSGHVLDRPYFLEEDSEEEELLTELDAELHLRCSPVQRQQRQLSSSSSGGAVRLSLNGLKDVEVNNSELCKQFEEQLLQLQETVLQREREINRLRDEKTRQRQVSQDVITERDKLKAELTALKDKNPDDLYLPQIKELEYTISQQQGETRQLKDKLTAHDAAAKRAIATLQSEMKGRIDQITKLYEDTYREKDSMVVKFAEAETKNIEAKCAEDKMEGRVRDLLKEKEFTNNKMRAAMGEKQKAVAELRAKMGEVGALQKELEKLREELSSADYRLKWHQNKLKAELDAHKETKTNLEKTTAKLKEAKEETEMIRKDCQAIVKTYQESEEVRSNSLDKELKMKETELMVRMKEYSDTEEIHLKTKQELDVLKGHHKDALEELKTLKDKTQCLDEERLQGEQVQAQYQNIIQKQKTDNSTLNKQLATMHTLQEDFDRAQEMIKNLDSEVSGLKLANRELQKDTEGCQARESKMLTLQSELSRTNALLRSENTSLSNQVATLSGEVQKLTMDIQDLDTRCRNMEDQLGEERSKRQEESSSLSAQLAVKSKESEDFKQKWEDEIDAIKTWKRKHTNNVKDLTRQLQQAKKRLEMYESGGGGGGGSGGSGERDVTSMGSRTNSNGSLNSMDNTNQHNVHAPHIAAHHTLQPPNHPPRQPSQEPEFPVIREQVEVDKQLLIERIVKLQRTLARKNEKLDFVEEHIQQLVQEIKKKNRIIQGYVMREEAGTLASDTMDANKREKEMVKCFICLP